jgi:hypothetical protein
MSGAGPRPRSALLLALVALGLLPLLPLLSRWCPPCSPLELVAEPWFDLHCHRDPSRTLQLGSVPLAVCARCSGIYFGVGLGALLRRPRLTPRGLRLWIVGASALMLLDLSLEHYGAHGAWSGGRLMSGLLLSYPVGVALTLVGARSSGASEAGAAYKP